MWQWLVESKGGVWFVIPSETDLGRGRARNLARVKQVRRVHGCGLVDVFDDDVGFLFTDIDTRAVERGL